MISIQEIKTYFETNPIPKDYQPYSFAKILDHEKFVNTHISFVIGGKPCRTNQPYYERLLEFYQYCITKNQSL
jgi:hypothetical protein